MARKPRGLTNRQAAEIGRLCRLLGRPYVGSGLSLIEASATIAQLRVDVDRARLDAQRQARTLTPR